MKNSKFRTLISMMVVLLWLQPIQQVAANPPSPTPKFKNVIMMVMDGTNSDVVTLARWYKGSNLFIDDLIVGGVRTYSLRSAITDSAAAATALATGHKTIVDHIGMIPMYESEHSSQPITTVPKATILEAAKRNGLATGIVATSPVQHATPAGFSSHTLHRDDFSNIAEQQVYQGIDVVLGGGKASLFPGKGKDERNDGENLIRVLKEQNYTIVDTKEKLQAAPSGKLWGAFARHALAYDFDRNTLELDQPSLAEMTEKAIQTLSQKKKGFFLFVEGSKVDWAAHKNDPVGMISEILSFDEAVKKAVEFAKVDKNTLVIAVTDHGNSGLTMGNGSTNNNYASSPSTKFIEPLKQAKLSVSGAVSILKTDRSNLVEVASYYGVKDLDRTELKQLKKAKRTSEIENLLTQYLAKRAHLGFTTHGHTGEDVFLYAYGPGKPSGLINNVDIPRLIAEYLEVDLDETTDSLFIDAEKWFTAQGFETAIELEGKNNEVFVAKKEGEEIRYPKNKNYRMVNSTVETLPGVNVFNGKTFFVPKPAR
ncbi:alkaline phosphatase [Bacillus carboniphilus]|uniref:Alkaline phosphatase n=1 Tax=Bacillus carboniphilus TaxID=86663 RepID=A0ABP3FDT2_9BACI